MLTPTRLYVKSCLAAIRETKAVKALAHITGGGFPDNIPRVLPKALGARIDLSARAGAAGVQMAGGSRRHRRERRCCAPSIAGSAWSPIVAPRMPTAVTAVLRREGDNGGQARRTWSPPTASEPRVRFAGALDLAMTAMARKRIAVLISGRGSNMAALIEAADDPAYPAEIALVLSNRPDAGGLARRERPRHRRPRSSITRLTARTATRSSARSRRSDAHRIDLSASPASCGCSRPGSSAHWQGRMLNIHPALLPAFKRPRHARTRARRGREDPWRDRAFRRAGDGFRPDHRAGPLCRCSRRHAETLAARVIAVEHRIYPLALRWLCEGGLQDRGRTLRGRGRGGCGRIAGLAVA